MALVLRRGIIDDAAACGDITYEAFRHIAERHGFPPDFPSPGVAREVLAWFFGRPEVYGVVAELDGKIAGSNFLTEGCPIAGVGPITVDPAAQNASVGRALMNDVLARAERKGFAGVRLVQAAYHGRSLSLYAKLGFAVREPLANLQGPPLREEIPGHPVRRARDGDVEAMNALGLRLHGFTRSVEVADAVVRKTATVVEREGRITGYATVVGFFGHTIGETDEDVRALVAAAPEFPGPGFLLPMRHRELFRWCLERSLRVVQPLTLMSLGAYEEPKGAFLPSILF